jgi:hypothetical protein
VKDIVFKEGFAFIYLNKGFYIKDTIFNSLNGYSDFLDYLYMDDENYHILKVSSKDDEYKLDYLCNEFLNYLVSEEYKFLAK